MVESELERAEKRIDDLSFENKKLKDEIRTYSNELKSFEAADEQYTERETQVSFIKIIFNAKNKDLYHPLLFSCRTKVATEKPN